VNSMERRWWASYIYVVYLFLATLPQLTNVPPFSLGIPILVLIGLYLYHSSLSLGKGALRFFVVAAGLGFLFEFVGVHTGFPFGRYYYTQGLGPQVLGVPLIIPLLWATLGYFCYTAVESPPLAAWLMVVLDLTVDPLFSRFDWHWLTSGQYFGVPVSNFVSWFLVSLIIFMIFRPSLRLKVNGRGMLFYLLLVWDLSLQDFFSGLLAPSLISTSLALITVMLIYLTTSRGQRQLTWPRASGRAQGSGQPSPGR